MTKPFVFLLALPFVVPRARADALLPLSGAAPELLACGLVALAALVLAYIGLRCNLSTDERARALQAQLAAEREAHAQSEGALADNHDLLLRLARQQEGVRDAERSRIARDLQADLGPRLLALRGSVGALADSVADAPAPALATRLEAVLGELDGAIGSVRMVADGMRGFGPGDGLRHALERCVSEHAHQYGLRYRFEAGVDSASRSGADRAARLAVFRVLQDVLSTSARTPDGQLHVRLLESAGMLGLEIDGCDGSPDKVNALSGDLVDQIRAMGGVLRVTASGARSGCWSLSLPVHTPVATLAQIA